jgi:hypothetical protein
MGRQDAHPAFPTANNTNGFLTQLATPKYNEGGRRQGAKPQKIQMDDKTLLHLKQSFACLLAGHVHGGGRRWSPAKRINADGRR